jgi:hypothetical protein
VQATPPVEFSAAADTTFPFWVGGRAQVLAVGHLAFSVGAGTTPAPYASAFGGAIADLSGNAALQDLIVGMLDSNFSWNLRLEYREEPHRGWGFGVGANFVNAKGDLGVRNTLSVLTGQTYPGGGATIHSTSSLFLGQIHGFYEFPLADRVGLKVSLGLLEILDAGIAFSSNSALFDQTAIAKTLYATTERQLKNLLFQYGISPFLGTELSFRF